MEMEKRLVARTLGEPLYQAVKVARLPVWELHLHRHVLPHDAIESDFAIRFSEQI
jgi:hypothetical protein